MKKRECICLFCVKKTEAVSVKRLEKLFQDCALDGFLGIGAGVNEEKMLRTLLKKSKKLKKMRVVVMPADYLRDGGNAEYFRNWELLDLLMPQKVVVVGEDPLEDAFLKSVFSWVKKHPKTELVRERKN